MNMQPQVQMNMPYSTPVNVMQPSQPAQASLKPRNSHRQVITEFCTIGTYINSSQQTVCLAFGEPYLLEGRIAQPIRQPTTTANGVTPQRLNTVLADALAAGLACKWRLGQPPPLQQWLECWLQRHVVRCDSNVELDWKSCVRSEQPSHAKDFTT